MTDDSSTPTVLLVHGAWHSPSIHYEKLVKGLGLAGFSVEAPKLPTINGDKPPTKTLWDDVSFVQQKARAFVESGRNVLVLAHSYGGIVATNAFTEELSYKKRHQEGSSGGIVQLVYLCAFMPQIGESVSTIFTDSGAVLEFNVDEQGCAIPKNPIEAFYADVALDEAKFMADNLIIHPIEAHATGATNTAWLHYPITYIYCELDQAIVISRQQDMVKAVQDAGISKIRTTTLKASHSPFLSDLQRAIEEVRLGWNAFATEEKYPLC